MSESTLSSVPMRETVKRGLILLHERFNRDHSEFLLHAAAEAGLDPEIWKPNMQTFTFDRAVPSEVPT
jgi:hypothetical protein